MVCQFCSVHVQNVRFSDDIIARVDEIARALARGTPGIQVTRSDALRAAVEAGLPALELKHGVVPEPKL